MVAHSQTCKSINPILPNTLPFQLVVRWWNVSKINYLKIKVKLNFNKMFKWKSGQLCQTDTLNYKKIIECGIKNFLYLSSWQWNCIRVPLCLSKYVGQRMVRISMRGDCLFCGLPLQHFKNVPFAANHKSSQFIVVYCLVLLCHQVRWCLPTWP